MPDLRLLCIMKLARNVRSCFYATKINSLLAFERQIFGQVDTCKMITRFTAEPALKPLICDSNS